MSDNQRRVIAGWNDVMKRTYIYILAAIVSIGSLAVIFLNPGEEIRLLAGIPLVTSIVIAMIKMLNDALAHDRALSLLNAQN